MKSQNVITLVGGIALLLLGWVIFLLGKRSSWVDLPTNGEGVPDDWDIDKTARQLDRSLGFWWSDFSIFFAISSALSPDQRAMILNYWKQQDRDLINEIEWSFMGSEEQVALDLYTF
jgi:hypothetical protein